MKPNSKPYMTKPYQTPLPQRSEFKKELYRKCSEQILRKLLPLVVEKSEWDIPFFGVPKKDKK